jgi:sugar phosphate isomerase/epimerase
MPQSKTLSRREVIKTAAFGALALPFLGSSSGCATASPAASAPLTPDAEHGLRLGVAGYTFRNLAVGESIAAMKILRLVNVGVFKGQLNWETATPDEARAVAEKYHAAGITLTSTGVINLPNDETKCRRAFENVRAAAVVTMLGKPDPDAIPLVEKLVKEYDQKLAIHNHGPEDKLYPSPASAFAAIKSLDARIGMCIDIGHTMRAKADPVASIRQYASRLYDLHMKDSVAVPGAEKDIPVEVGAGRLDIRGVLRALLDINYRGIVGFEYEREAVNPVTGLAESVGFVRGALAAMS